MTGFQGYTTGNEVRTIGIDCRFAKTDSGIGRYTRELVTHLLQRDDPRMYILFVRDGDQHGLGDLPKRKNFQFSIFNFQHYSLGEQLFFRRAIQRSQVSLMHFPHFNIPFRCPAPFVATIHDLILHAFPNRASLPKQLACRTLMKHAVTHAAHIIAVSRHTADEIVRTYGSGVREKISVIHEGVSPQFQPQPDHEQQRVRGKYGLPDDFILSVGACKEHKNVQTLIDACPAERTLVLVTGGRETARLRMRPNVRIFSNVNDGDLPALYSAASCYAQPSLAEGFCLPILEAMACGCAVIASNRGSIPEIAGGHAILVEPTVEGIAKGIEQVSNKLQTPGSKLQAIHHTRSFSWEKTAQQTANVYRALLFENGRSKS